MTGRSFASGCLGIALLLAAFATPPAMATSFAPLTIEQYTDASTYIVEGTVREVWTELDPASGLVWTNARIAVTNTLKGPSAATELVVSSAGGTYGAYEMFVPGMAQFSVDEDVFTFLDELPNGRLVPVGKFSGKYTVRRAAGDTRAHAMLWQGTARDKFDARFLPAPPVESRLYVDDLREEVQHHLDIGWDGKPIPGMTPERLQQINTLERRQPR